MREFRRLLSTAAIRIKPRIAVFSGPQSTVANTAPLITSNKARASRGLPLRCDAHGEPLAVDAMRLQRLAAPVEVLIEQFSEHPLAADSAELHGPPDGYCNPETGAFSEQQLEPHWVPCFKATLRPEDGPYALPFMGVTRSGAAWDGPCSPEGDRQTFYPDASAMFAEIDRCGWSADGDAGLLSSQADFTFYRACPPGGYTKGLAAAQRTDHGSASSPSAHADIPPERDGSDFFRYYPYHLSTPPTASALLRATNLVQRTLSEDSGGSDEAASDGGYAGCQWLEASCGIEETLYWLSLVIDTTKPIVGHAAQRPHGTIGADGDMNILRGAQYINSRVWAASEALALLGGSSNDASCTSDPPTSSIGERDMIGAVLIVDDQAFSAREVAKTDARPGNYAAVGGHGGIVASLNLMPTLTFIPTRKATWRSELNLTRLPMAVQGLPPGGGALVDVPVRDASGDLQALPRVHIVKGGHYATEGRQECTLAPFNGTRGVHGDFEGVVPGEAASQAAGVRADLDAALREAPLCGFIAEGANPYAYVDEDRIDAALLFAVFSGVPVCRVARGNTGGFCYPSGPFFVAGSNLTSTKARVLLQAAILKLGMLPPAADPEQPTTAERTAIAERVAAFQQIFDTH